MLEFRSAPPPFPVNASPLDTPMYATAPPLDYSALEKIRELELEEARAIQSAMVPTGSLRSGKVTITHQLRPVRDVGGDFLDYFALSDRSIGLFLGDVSGKGLPAALYAALAVGTLRGIHKTGTCPADVLALVNRRLAGRAVPRRYSALQYAVFDPDPGRMPRSSGYRRGVRRQSHTRPQTFSRQDQQDSSRREEYLSQACRSLHRHALSLADRRTQIAPARTNDHSGNRRWHHHGRPASSPQIGRRAVPPRVRADPIRQATLTKFPLALASLRTPSLHRYGPSAET